MMRSLWFILCPLLLQSGPASAEDGTVRGSVINVFPQGSKSIAIVNRGRLFGLQPGQVATCFGEREFLCKVTEVYDYRLKCIADVESSHFGSNPWCRFTPPPRRRVPASVLEVVPEGETTTFVFDKGHQDGLAFSDWAELDGKRCRIWRLENERAACAVEAVLATRPKEFTVVSWLLPGATLRKPLIASPPELVHERPARGSQDRARPVAVVRAHGHGVVAASRCVGFTPDESAAFVLGPGATGLAPWPDERGLELQRIDLSTGAATVVHTFEPARVLEARRQLEALVDRERLLACHEAERATRSTVGDRGFMAHHRLDKILFWSAEDVIYAAMEGGAGLAERVGRGPLDTVWFVPGLARHLGQSGDRWQVLEVR